MISLDDVNTILRGIWRGNINVNTLPKKVFNENNNKLTEGVEKGFGSKLSDLNEGTPRFKTMQSLQNNVTFFSAAKTFQQVNAMQFSRFDEKGFILSFNDFKKEAAPVMELYNVTWLETEFNTSISQSQSAELWATIQEDKKELPLLQYQTADDERVRDEHTAWDNIIRPVDDPFWNTHYAPNGYNCRCQIIQLSKGTVSSLSGVPKNKDLLFADNSGKSEEVFKETGDAKHPYFDAPQKKKDNNFGL